MNRLIKFWTSLRLTVVLLAFAIVLVFVGTVAQADEGLYQAQTQYFKSFFVGFSLHPFQFNGVSMFGWHIPIVLPGGYLIGFMLLINLIAAQVARFQFTRKKSGIYIAHVGIVLLLVGQLTTDLLSKESMLRFSEGETKNYSESPRNYELVFTSDAGNGTEDMISIPERLLAKGGDIKSDQLPFTLRIKQFWANSQPSFRAPMQQNGPPLTTNGIAQHFDFSALPEVKTMDERNIPTALIEIIGSSGSLGDWVVSDWAGEEAMASALRGSYAQMGRQIAEVIGNRLATPQTIEAGGKKYTFTIRPERTYRAAALTLLKFTHSVYPGTVNENNPEGIPKDFRSRVRLENPKTGENREVEIYMNAPLRYKGETFYQASFDKFDPRVSILEVVHNPSWLTPYIGCIMVALGLVIQFMYHLVGFVGKRKLSVAQAAPKMSPQQTKAVRAERRAQPQENVRP